MELKKYSWNKQLIVQHFHPADVPVILSIPLRKADDFVAWHFDSRGIFSVKSTYKVHVEMLKRSQISQVEQGSEAIEQRYSKKIWQVQCPPKVHHFLWRLARNSHPLYMN
jgi:hypothetical protein